MLGDFKARCGDVEHLPVAFPGHLRAGEIGAAPATTRWLMADHHIRIVDLA